MKRRDEETNRKWLVTLPHAGGSSSLYKGWNKKLDMNVLNIEYPGHWSRLKEPLIETFEELKVEVIKNIVDNICSGSHVFLFGHSLGAILAWEVSKELDRYGIIVDRLFISGSHSPSGFPERNLQEITNDEEVLGLIGYKNTSNNLLDEQIKKIVLPIIKNDINVCKSYKFKHNYVAVETIVFYGVDDTFTNAEGVADWKKYSNCTSIIGLAGEHFFLSQKENQEAVFDAIKNGE